MRIEKSWRNNNLSNSLNPFLRIRHRRTLSLTGFTLVEILLALAILGIGLVSILSLFAVGTHSAGRALNVTRASLLAQLTLEELKQLSFTDFGNSLLTNGSHNETAINAKSNKSNMDEYKKFNRALNVKDDPLNTGMNQLKRLELTVSWNSGKFSEVFVAYVSK